MQLKTEATKVQVVSKDSFSGSDGKPVRFIELAGWGFTKRIMTEDEQEWSGWPKQGEMVAVQFDVSPGKDGKFSLNNPSFRALKGDKSAA